MLHFHRRLFLSLALLRHSFDSYFATNNIYNPIPQLVRQLFWLLLWQLHRQLLRWRLWQLLWQLLLREILWKLLRQLRLSGISSYSSRACLLIVSLVEILLWLLLRLLASSSTNCAMGTDSAPALPPPTPRELVN
jgi:hypothetical protein